MKIPSHEEIIEEVESLKKYMFGRPKMFDFQMGIGRYVESQMKNRLNKILRMLRSPVLRVDFDKFCESKRNKSNEGKDE